MHAYTRIMAGTTAALAATCAVVALLPTPAPTTNYSNRYNASTHISAASQSTHNKPQSQSTPSHHSQAAPSGVPSKLPQSVNRYCTHKVFVNCYNVGNRPDHSPNQPYIVRLFPGKADLTCVIYINKKYARTHDYCA